MKNLIKILLLILLFVLLVNPTGVLAQRGTVPPDKPTRPVRETIVQKFINRLARLTDAQITAINGTVITATENGKTYTINTSDQTRFRRHFWGKSDLNEFSVGNQINVWGRWADDEKTIINARFIRNLSIQKRHGVFIGTVKSKTDTSFVLESINRGDQTVYFDANTKFVNRKQETITYSNVNQADRVRVKGLWDKSLNKITEVTQVKDFSQPPKPTGAVGEPTQ